MNNQTQLQQLKHEKILIFGAGKIAGATIRYLKDQGLEENLIGILDNNEDKTGTSYEGLLIHRPADHLQRPETNGTPPIIIIAILDYPDAYRQILDLAPDFPRERIYLSLSWKIPYGDDPERSGFGDLTFDGKKFDEFSPEEIRSMLADEESRQLFDLIRSVRGGHVNLFRYDELDRINGSSIYWGRSDLQKSAAPGHHPCAIVDCGAYTGDSISEILTQLQPQQCSYYAFEPDGTVLAELEAAETAVNEERAKRSLPAIEFHNIPKGAWHCDQTLQFNYYTEDAASSLNQNHNLEDGAQGSIQVTAIDHLQIAEDRLYIKMDIEGSELAALRGAEKLIREKKTYLAICAYHRPHDLFYIPLMMRHLDPDCRIHLAGGMHYTYYAI